eukprot:CAMPEP_0119034402 /NCGR_PEP_ID=MMETSP1177-20130426/1391_1 /TAXON_ID=2985 /ORGANISM="Ochromonas sp, Strain CCMP1899" /LENGTH=235 /DNA_ID=CAMNT_0006991813 /DNA_START=142 /DNA_END=849 /DNA_ORIENTATION=+
MENIERELSEAQKERIELNRQKAVKRKREAEETKKIEAVDTAEGTLCCQYTTADNETVCGNEPIAKDLWDIFEEQCCETCRHLNDDYGTLNQTDVSSKYLIPVDSIKMMKFSSKINPRNAGFAPMKLYLRKHAREKSFKRWGNEEGLLKELDRREKEKFERGLADCEDALEPDEGDSSLLASLSNENSSSSVSLDDDQEEGVQKKKKKAKISSAQQKRSAQLGKMMLAIKGEDKK